MAALPKGLEKILGSRIKKAREDKGMSQSDLARETDIEQSHISKIEAGYFPRSNVFLIGRIAKVLGITLDSLITGNEEKILSLDEISILDKYRPLSKKKKEELKTYLKFVSN